MEPFNKIKISLTWFYSPRQVPKLHMFPSIFLHEKPLEPYSSSKRNRGSLPTTANGPSSFNEGPFRNANQAKEVGMNKTRKP